MSVPYQIISKPARQTRQLYGQVEFAPFKGMDRAALRKRCEFDDSDVIALLSFLAPSFRDLPEDWAELEMCRGGRRGLKLVCCTLAKK